MIDVAFEQLLSSQGGVFQVWRHTWRINLMLQSAQCELIIHYLLGVSRKSSQSSSPYISFSLLPLCLPQVGT